MAFVSFLTDFGILDPFVGEMKGVLASLAPDARPVDLTHGIARGNIREGAWILERTWEAFPPGTVHVAVVDPGVGTDRRPLVARAGDRYFVGPDNGLLVPALDAAGSAEIREIGVRDPDHVPRGSTFDGRDRFTPAAASLVHGAGLDEFGPAVRDPVRLPSWRPHDGPGGWSVEIIRVDGYGNLVTTAEESFLREAFGEDWRDVRVQAGGERLDGVRTAYAEVPEGTELISIGGGGTLEISVRGGSAAERLGLGAGDRVFLADPAEGPEAVS